MSAVLFFKEVIAQQPVFSCRQSAMKRTKKKRAEQVAKQKFEIDKNGDEQWDSYNREHFRLGISS